MRAQTIHLVPWEADFIDALARFILEDGQAAAGDLSRYLIVFPHIRPQYYLTERLLKAPELPKPCLLPEMQPLGLLLSRLRTQAVREPLRTAGLLDQVGLLRDCVRRVRDAAPGRLGGLPLDDLSLFFPWGCRLATLMEDLFRLGPEQGAPGTLALLEEDAAPFAVALLEQLDNIFAAYVEGLAAASWTTPAQDAWLLGKNPDRALELLQDRRVILAGFDEFSVVEEQLVRRLWEQGGAELLLHADPLLAAPQPGAAPHWSCRPLQELCRRWGALPQLYASAASAAGDADSGPSMRFYRGFDLHSQLHAMQNELTPIQRSCGQRTAVVLTDPGMLLPVLHHLERKDVNIGMGFPLQRAPLHRLLELLLRLQENSPRPDVYYWKDCLECIRHPYVKMLRLGPLENDQQPLRPLFADLEAQLRKEQKYTRPTEWEMPYDERQEQVDPQQLEQLWDTVIRCCFTQWERLASLEALAGALEDLCLTLIEHGGELWKHFPIDAECLHRLLHNVIPALANSSISSIKLKRETLFSILRELLRAEHVPFEAEDLADIQLLGLRETRLLHFDNVLILGANDEQLPGNPGRDPLLPDALRPLLGLPDGRETENRTAYQVFRLIQGARNVIFCSQSGIQGGDRKSTPSRFVEELVWEEEKRRGQALTPFDPPLFTVHYPMRAIRHVNRGIEKSPDVQEALVRRMQRGLSPSVLDTYLRCPAQFCYAEVFNLRGPDEVDEQGSMAEIGSMTHEVLQEFLTPWVGRYVTAEQLNPDALAALFTERLEQNVLAGNLPYDRLLLLRTAGQIRMRQFVRNFSATTILELEDTHPRMFSCDGLEIKLSGKIDRVDQRENGLLILDYKTGRPRLPRLAFWQEQENWDLLAQWDPAADTRDETLATLYGLLKSIQLPSYMYLYAPRASGARGQLQDAALVRLGNECEELALLGPDCEDGLREQILADRIPALLDFLLRHMLHSSHFFPRPDKHCEWCAFRNGCENGV